MSDNFFIGVILFLCCTSLVFSGFAIGEYRAQIKKPEQFIHACMKSNEMDYNLAHSEYPQYLERCKQASKAFFYSKNGNTNDSN